jgi:hypothetical protein
MPGGHEGGSLPFRNKHALHSARGGREERVARHTPKAVSDTPGTRLNGNLQTSA